MIRQIENSYLEFIANYFPVQATSLGISGNDGELGLYTDTVVNEIIHKANYLISKTDSVKAENDFFDEVDTQLLISNLEILKHDFEILQTHQVNPTFYIDTALTGCLLLFLRDIRNSNGTIKDNLMNRLNQFPNFFINAKKTLLKDEIPEIFLNVAKEMSSSSFEFLDKIDVYFSHDRDYSGKIHPIIKIARIALYDFFEFIKQINLNKGSRNHSIGENQFLHRLRVWHLLDNNLSDLLEHANIVINDTLLEMKSISSKINGESDLIKIIGSLTKNVPDNKNILSIYKNEINKVKQFVIDSDIATFPLNDNLKVITTPEFQQPIIPSAAYISPPPLIKKQSGFFLVTPAMETSSHCIFEIPVIALHESFPGHHLQYLMTNSNNSIIRRIHNSPLFSEGWATYCEEMMGEFGFYEDSRVKFFQLYNLLLRCCRTIVDILTHRDGINISEAERIFTTKALLPRDQAQAEIRQVALYPALQLSYLIGKKEIIELRDGQKEKLGNYFNLKEFHNKLLENGALPLKLVKSVFENNYTKV